MPPISNLLFADDFLILMKANMQHAEALKSILDSNCVVSRQMVMLQNLVSGGTVFFLSTRPTAPLAPLAAHPHSSLASPSAVSDLDDDARVLKQYW